MNDSQIIQFAPAFQRRLAHATHARRFAVWRNRYAEGIDGLRALPTGHQPTDSQILPFARPASV